MATIQLVAGVVKAWINASVAAGTPSIDDSLNVTSITDVDVGLFIVNWSVTFDNADYCAHCTAIDSGGIVFGQILGQSTTTTTIALSEPATPSTVDTEGWNVSVVGDGPA